MVGVKDFFSSEEEGLRWAGACGAMVRRSRTRLVASVVNGYGISGGGSGGIGYRQDKGVRTASLRKLHEWGTGVGTKDRGDGAALSHGPGVG